MSTATISKRKPARVTKSTAEGPLSAGELDTDDCTITCEWHGAMFDIRSGRPLCLPAIKPVETFPCRSDGEGIWVEIG